MFYVIFLACKPNVEGGACRRNSFRQVFLSTILFLNALFFCYFCNKTKVKKIKSSALRAPATGRNGEPVVF